MEKGQGICREECEGCRWQVKGGKIDVLRLIMNSLSDSFIHKVWIGFEGFKLRKNELPFKIIPQRKLG